MRVSLQAGWQARVGGIGLWDFRLEDLECHEDGGMAGYGIK
jgi:hypothetical protein